MLDSATPVVPTVGTLSFGKSQEVQKINDPLHNMGVGVGVGVGLGVSFWEWVLVCGFACGCGRGCG